MSDGFKRLSVLFQLLRTHELSRELVSRLLDPLGVRGEDYAALSALYANGSLSPSELARALDAPPTTISGYAARFVAAGWATRRDNPLDGRSYLLELTAEGRATVERVMPVFTAGMQVLHRHLGEGGVAEVFAALERLQAALRATLSEVGEDPVN